MVQQPPPPPWESAEFVPMDGPDAGGYFPAGVPPINSLWGDSFFYQPDPQSAFSRSAFAPPLGAPPPPAVPRPFIPDPRTPLPYAAVAAGKGIPKTHSNPSVLAANGREVPSPPLPLPVPVPVQMPVPMPPPPEDGASVLGFYASDKPPEAVYAPIGYQNYPIAPWPIYGPFAAYPHPVVYGPYPTGPISASLEYERRPPARSTELFDPKAPTQRRTAPPQTHMHPYPYPQLYDPSAFAPQPGRGQMQGPASRYAFFFFFLYNMPFSCLIHSLCYITC